MSPCLKTLVWEFFSLYKVFTEALKATKIRKQSGVNIPGWCWNSKVQLLTTAHSLHHCRELYGAARLFVGWIFVDPDYQKFEEFKRLFVFNMR